MATKDETVEADETIEPKDTVTEQVKTEKVFTQADLDRHIKNRVEREKKVFGEEKQTWETERTSLEAERDAYLEDLKAFIAEKTKDFAPFALDLFNKLPLREQLDMLKNEQTMGEMKKPVIPSSPPPSDKPKEFRPHKVDKVI